MHVSVNGVRLFFDVEGTKLVPDGPVMREKPTLLMLHGGPGSVHSIYRPAYAALADIAQIVYLDHRGNGRSGDGPRSEVLQWFMRPGGESHTFDMLGDLTASDVRPWYSVARTIPFTQSRARRISRRRCRSIWCGSNGLRIAGTRW